MATLRHYLLHDKVEIQYKREQAKRELYVCFLLDSSGSMMKDKQIAFIKGLVAATIDRYKTRRIKYAAVALHNGTAQLLSAPTLHADELLQAIGTLKTGGKTNMQSGFALLHQLMKTNTQQKASLYIFTDGKINAGNTDSPFEEAVRYYKQFLSSFKETTVVDNERGFVKLGKAGVLAEAINAKLVKVETNF
ncbi:vWA domain-containing protein [Chitinophaga pinensis]|uniref:vWA domain-containing protein n=1 Tax=Chitinophaga pinensis TaxID=79329 RepID=UPI0021BD4C82|nr:VWA domain-containing protein [Chitinophaga pinensis]